MGGRWTRAWQSDGACACAKFGSPEMSVFAEEIQGNIGKDWKTKGEYGRAVPCFAATLDVVLFFGDTKRKNPQLLGVHNLF